MSGTPEMPWLILSSISLVGTLGYLRWPPRYKGIPDTESMWGVMIVGAILIPLFFGFFLISKS